MEVIDVRTIAPLDEETIGRSARKTGRVVLVTEAVRDYGPANEWGMVVMEHAFEYLQAPVMRVTGRNFAHPVCQQHRERRLAGYPGGRPGDPRRGGMVMEAWQI